MREHHSECSIVRQEDRYRITLERLIAHPPERIWQMLTHADCLPLWLAPGAIKPPPNGHAVLDFQASGSRIDSSLTAFQTNQCLGYHWNESGKVSRPLVWQLQPLDNSTHLTLTLDLPLDEDIAKACAGWECHLEMLSATLEGINISFPHAHFKQVRSQFSQQLEDLASDQFLGAEAGI